MPASLTEPARVLIVAMAAADFCVLSSGVYLINDVFDAAEDRLHPTKRLRAVTAGLVPARAAILAAVPLDLIALAVAWRLDRVFY